MKNVEKIYYEECLFAKTKLPNNVLDVLKQKSYFILKNENQFKKLNQELAGNLEKEYSVDDEVIKILNPYLLDLANEYFCSSKKEKQPSSWSIDRMWVNFQKKHEHNPIHHHSGYFSFVSWIQIPYLLQEELSLSNSKNSNGPSNSLFQFVFTGIYGKTTTYNLEIDKSWEGTIVMFPSFLQHLVYPFHTSDDYRISISGNLSPIFTKLKKNLVYC